MQDISLNNLEFTALPHNLWVAMSVDTDMGRLRRVLFSEFFKAWAIYAPNVANRNLE